MNEMEKKVLEVLKKCNTTKTISFDTGRKDNQEQPIYEIRKAEWNLGYVSEKLELTFNEFKNIVNKTRNKELENEWVKYQDYFWNRQYEEAISNRDKDRIKWIEEHIYGAVDEDKYVPDITFEINEGCEKCDCPKCITHFGENAYVPRPIDEDDF